LTVKYTANKIFADTELGFQAPMPSRPLFFKQIRGQARPLYFSGEWSSADCLCYIYSSRTDSADMCVSESGEFTLPDFNAGLTLFFLGRVDPASAGKTASGWIKTGLAPKRYFGKFLLRL
jgi:hypothetical protein